MDPITAGLFVAASFASSLITSRNQRKIEDASMNVQVEQARLQTAEAAYERTKQFRQNISMNLALSGMGIGGVSGFRGAAAQSASAYFADAAALGRQDVFAQLTGTSNKALSKAKRFSSLASGVIDAAGLASQLGLFKSPVGKTK